MSPHQWSPARHVVELRKLLQPNHLRMSRRRRRTKLLRPPLTKEGAGVKQPVLLRLPNNQQGGEEGVREQATPRHHPWQLLQALGFPGQEDLTLQGLTTKQASP